jgi:hypothetical protein
VSPKEQQELHEVVAEQAAQRVKIENIEKTCQEIRDCLLGNGKPGLVVRTDRLEQKDKVRAKLFWLVFSTLAAVTAKVLADTFGVSF